MDGTNGVDGVDGDQRPQGEPGPQGPAGGLSGWELVQHVFNLSGTGAQTITATGPVGKVALGGGLSSSIGTSMRASYPSASDIWTVTFDRISGSSAYTATAYAVCANQVS